MYVQFRITSVSTPNTQLYEYDVPEDLWNLDSQDKSKKRGVTDSPRRVGPWRPEEQEEWPRSAQVHTAKRGELKQEAGRQSSAPPPPDQTQRGLICPCPQAGQLGTGLVWDPKAKFLRPSSLPFFILRCEFFFFFFFFRARTFLVDKGEKPQILKAEWEYPGK